MTAIPIADSHPSNNAIFPNGTSCFDNHCCLRIVLVSAVKKEKGLPQCKVLRKDFCTVQSWDIWSHFLLCELMLLVQANIETGRKGIVLFLLWSLPLSGLGWYLQQRSQRRAATDLDEGHVELITEEQHPSKVVDHNIDERPVCQCSSWLDTLKQQ